MSDQRRMLSSVRPMAASVSSFHSPTSAQVMRPSGRTAVASIVRSAAPESASWPRWIRCQSVMHPSSAEYWHMGAITIRLRRSRLPTRIGWKRADCAMMISPCAARQKRATSGMCSPPHLRVFPPHPTETGRRAGKFQYRIAFGTPRRGTIGHRGAEGIVACQRFRHDSAKAFCDLILRWGQGRGLNCFQHASLPLLRQHRC